MMTFTAAPKAAIALETISTPFCVLVRYATNDPSATTMAPIPVDMSATFKIFIAVDRRLVETAAAFWVPESVLAADAPSKYPSLIFTNSFFTSDKYPFKPERAVTEL